MKRRFMLTSVFILIVVAGSGVQNVEAQLWPQVPLWEIYVQDHHILVRYFYFLRKTILKLCLEKTSLYNKNYCGKMGYFLV